MDIHKICNEQSTRFAQKPPKDLLARSQEAGRIVLEALGFSNLQYEAEGRVDIIAEHPSGTEWRMELKLISMIIEMKGLVLHGIRQTKTRINKKNLTHLLFITLLRHKASDDEHFIKAKEYCLLGIFVSRSELEKKNEKEIAAEIAQEVEKYLDPEVDLVSVSKAEYQEILRLEDERMQLMDNLEKKVEGIEDKVDGIEDKVEGIEGKVEGIEGKVEGIEGKVEGIEGKVEGIEDKIKGIKDNISSIENKVNALSAQNENLHNQLANLGTMISRIADALDRK